MAFESETGMKYQIHENLADMGFTFFEKIREPILLTNDGRVIKMNESMRKFFKIARLSVTDVENYFREALALSSTSILKKNLRIRIVNSRIQLIMRSYESSQICLIELRHLTTWHQVKNKRS